MDLCGPPAARTADRLTAFPLYGMAHPSPPPFPSRQLEGEMDIHVLGIDLGKNSCSVVGLDPTGCVVLRRRTRRESIVGLAAKLPGCVVAMEACCGAHHLGRLLNRGRDLSAWLGLGLGPRQATTGGKPKLLGITKRGSKYLRKLIIQGGASRSAWAVQNGDAAR